MHQHVSSWTLAACGETIGSVEWVQVFEGGKTHYWNRRSNETLWNPPEGIQVVWIGEKSADGGIWYWHRYTRVSTWGPPTASSWLMGLGVRGLASPHMCKAGVAGLFHFARPRCLASWSVWTRRTVVQCTGFARDHSPRSMLPSVDDRPKMLDIMAVMDQKNSYVVIGGMFCWFCW